MKATWISIAAMVALAACGAKTDDSIPVAHDGTALVDTTLLATADSSDANTAPTIGDLATTDPDSTDQFRELVWLMPNWSATRLLGPPSFASLSQADGIVGTLVAVKPVGPTTVDLADIFPNAPRSAMMDTAAVDLVVEVERASQGAKIESGSQVVVRVDLGLLPQPGEGSSLAIAATDSIAAAAPIGIRLVLVGRSGENAGEWTLARETGFEAAPGLFSVFFLQSDGAVHSLDPRLQGNQLTNWLGAAKTEADLLAAFRI